MFINTIILGGGPAGVQLGYFLSQINQDYIIFEKSSQVGSFFSKYPHSNELISINKVFTGKTNDEFNLRHDWNSLINNFELQMKDFTDKYYPSRNDIVIYLNEFVKKYALKVQFNTTIIHITKQDNKFILKSQDGSLYYCNKLIIATGLSKPNIPYITNINKYSKHYADFQQDYFLKSKNLKKYKNKKLLILGQGNSAFELANILTPFCSSIVILGRNHAPKPSFCTHYIGDLRSKYFHFYDTFLLKSLNAFDSMGPNTHLIVSKKNNLLYLEQVCSKALECDECVPTNFFREPNIGFDEIINCTGWSFDDTIFDLSIKPLIDTKYPKVKGNYESVNIDNLFFIGSLMHSFDYKKSSGGFIHGFRYLIDNFVKINFTSFTPLKFNTIADVSNHFYKRINISSALYQMHGQLCDIFYVYDNQFIYYEHVPLSYICTSINSKIDIPNTFIFVLTLEYGYKVESDLKLIGKRTTDIGTESNAILLHPILRIFNNANKDFGKYKDFYPTYDNLKLISNLVNIIHFDEDLLTNFTNKQIYLEKFFRIINSYV